MTAKKTLLTTTEANDIIEKIIGKRLGPNAIISWCKRYGIGRKIGGRWFIDESKLQYILQEGSYFEENKTRRVSTS